MRPWTDSRTWLSSYGKYLLLVGVDFLILVSNYVVIRCQHQRIDRNNILDIKWENIAEDDHQWFYRFDNAWEKFDTGYDPWSCMHYAKDGFSKNGKNTMVPHDSKFLDVIGTQLTLSRGDAIRINRMYNCPEPYEQ